HKLKIETVQFNTAQIAAEKKLSIQECARNLRYDWFNLFLQKEENSFLLTAHHLDDSIETFFINLFRGTGYRGLAGIPPMNGKIIRPLSEFTADEIYRYIDLNKIEYRTDSSNAKKDYLRNKIRHDLIPELLELQPDMRSKMSTLFEELNDLKKYMNTERDKFNQQFLDSKSDYFRYPITALKECDPFLREHVLNTYGIHRKNAAEFEKFLHAQTGSEFFTSNNKFIIDRDLISILPNKKLASDLSYLIEKLPFQQEINSSILSLSESKDTRIDKTNQAIQKLDLAQIKLPVQLRHWKNGDRMKPLGMRGTKLISDILTDNKISSAERSMQLVLEDHTGEIISIPGMVISEDFKITEDSTMALIIELTI
ncbi:MAG: tRNA lysidine(34) synthetase TilS, partial [Crocinitomicaceae bacterium]|nr:tRNA lysidine(34) synthetase TilS [Crocinitomicaceae bacterium]